MIETHELRNAHALWMNAEDLGFSEASFDIVLSGFMGWYDCFDFIHDRFTRPDKKSRGIWRVLKEGCKVVIGFWDRQEDLRWMEEVFIRNFPRMAEDEDCIEGRPIGVANESTEGYQLILKDAGFKNIEVFNERAEFVFTTEENWWEQMRTVGWDRFFKKVGSSGAKALTRIKESIFRELQTHKRPDGIYFMKSAFLIAGSK